MPSSEHASDIVPELIMTAFAATVSEELGITRTRGATPVFFAKTPIMVSLMASVG